jgi:hypothetical protein
LENDHNRATTTARRIGNARIALNVERRTAEARSGHVDAVGARVAAAVVGRALRTRTKTKFINPNLLSGHTPPTAQHGNPRHARGDEGNIANLVDVHAALLAVARVATLHKTTAKVKYT